MCNDQGELIEIYGSIRNISSIKEKEQQLEKTVNELRDHYNDMMQFNYIVSHNLRSPLANIIGTINLYEMPGVTEREKHTIIDFIKTSSEKMDTVLKDLNAILAARSATVSKKEKVNIRELIDSVTNTLEKQLFDSEMYIKTHLSHEVTEIFTIKSYLESVFYNLVVNAIKYKAANRIPKLLISSHKRDKFLVLEFKDNGMGIDMEKNGKNMFGLYKRFHPAVEGKGMGLFMTKTQIETLGGKISVESEVNKGTTFIIQLPLTSDEDGNE